MWHPICSITDQALLTRLVRLFPSQVTDAGELLVEGREERSQRQNRDRAASRALAMLADARKIPKKRRPRSKKLPPGVKKQRESDADKRRRTKQYRRKPGAND